MKAMILAAGLGTRLRPWTLEHPKALVPVRGVPMLERVLTRLEQSGYDTIAINIYHFGDQIIDYLGTRTNVAEIIVSDERDRLLDTGGGLLAASRLLMKDDSAPFLVHNVDILSDTDLSKLMEWHLANEADITLLTSDRESSRKLMFDSEGNLKGWHNISSDEYRPAGAEMLGNTEERAFSGIYIIGVRGIERLRKYSEKMGVEAFPIMDFFLSECSHNDIVGKEPEGKLRILGCHCHGLRLIDIGKPASLEEANSGVLA